MRTPINSILSQSIQMKYIIEKFDEIMDLNSDDNIIILKQKLGKIKREL